MICIMWPHRVASNHGTQQSEEKDEVRRDISKEDRITILLSKPKQPRSKMSEKTFT